MTACPHRPHRPASIEALDAHVAAVHGKGAFRLVRAEPSEEMCSEALDEHAQRSTSVEDNSKLMVLHAQTYLAMLAASEPPTDAELRELARLMWSDKPHWGRPDLPKGQPTEALCQDDIARMKRFLAALTGHKP